MNSTAPLRGAHVDIALLKTIEWFRDGLFWQIQEKARSAIRIQTGIHTYHVGMLSLLHIRSHS